MENILTRADNFSTFLVTIEKLLPYEQSLIPPIVVGLQAGYAGAWISPEERAKRLAENDVFQKIGLHI